MVLEVSIETLPVPSVGGRSGTALGSGRLVGVDVLQRVARPLALRRLRQLGQRILRLSIDRGENPPPKN